ncbi:hypothetical protein J3369_00275 [Alteromonas sp. NFXS44]|uniref:hypothetical protein n=1 Tax=Alteromonas sp. NFXS44 TaxID=2818435 RepID=UPI0032DE4546
MARLTIFIFFITFTQISYAGYDFQPSTYQCAGVEQQIKQINSKMRAGYSSREGEKFREDLRRLKSHRDSCKKAGFKVD